MGEKKKMESGENNGDGAHAHGHAKPPDGVGGRDPQRMSLRDRIVGKVSTLIATHNLLQEKNMKEGTACFPNSRLTLRFLSNYVFPGRNAW